MERGERVLLPERHVIEPEKEGIPPGKLVALREGHMVLADQGVAP
jgi:hypothetical protein